MLASKYLQVLNGLEGISSLIVPPLFVTARCVFGFFGGASLENLIGFDQNTAHDLPGKRTRGNALASRPFGQHRATRCKVLVLDINTQTMLKYRVMALLATVKS